MALTDAVSDGYLMGILRSTFDWFGDPANWTGSRGIPQRLFEHVQISLIAIILASIPAIALGLYIGHKRRFEFVTVNISNLGRALPSFAILAFFFPIQLRLGLGLSSFSIIVALTLLAIPPILTNTYVGVKEVEGDLVEAARGMGMTDREILRQIEVPLAAPLVVAGLRTAAVAVVATASLGAVIAGGGLGRFIMDGFAISSAGYPQVMGGAILIALLAVLTELAFGWLEKAVTPKAISGRPSRLDLAADPFENRAANDATIFEPPPASTYGRHEG